MAVDQRQWDEEATLRLRSAGESTRPVRQVTLPSAELLAAILGHGDAHTAAPGCAAEASPGPQPGAKGLTARSKKAGPKTGAKARGRKEWAQLIEGGQLPNL
jgi:hypothetical protein